MDRQQDVARRLGEALDALEGMVEQHCTWPDKEGYHHKFYTANEVALRVLEREGRLRQVEELEADHMETRIGRGGVPKWLEPNATRTDREAALKVAYRQQLSRANGAVDALAALVARRCAVPVPVVRPRGVEDEEVFALLMREERLRRIEGDIYCVRWPVDNPNEERGSHG